ncbi:MAG TPA: class E sortase [Candidatus Saccharimonadales bacterium]|nr:class E sortase [Candidatus Saccharimonadales bacterium]
MKLARVNTLLLAAILAINGYIVLVPVIPKIIFWTQQHDTRRIQRLEAAITHPPIKEERPRDNRLVIPTMVFDESIHEGHSERTLRQGLWRRPQTSTPDQGGNTVLAGHRLTYSNPRGTLYNLDKVRVGDDIALWWEGKRYHYQVSESRVVAASETSVEEPTKNSRLTIYTCTPLWMPKDRLVVIAELKDIQ